MNVDLLQKRAKKLKEKLKKTRDEIKKNHIEYGERRVACIGESFSQAYEDGKIDKDFYFEVLGTYVRKKRDREMLGLGQEPKKDEPKSSSDQSGSVEQDQPQEALCEV